MVQTYAKANRTDGIVACILGSMSASCQVNNKQRTVVQFHRLAIAVRVIHEESVVRCWCRPRQSAVRAKDNAQSVMTWGVRTMQAHKRIITQNVNTGCKHS